MKKVYLYTRKDIQDIYTKIYYYNKFFGVQSNDWLDYIGIRLTENDEVIYSENNGSYTIVINQTKNQQQNQNDNTSF